MISNFFRGLNHKYFIPKSTTHVPHAFPPHAFPKIPNHQNYTQILFQNQTWFSSSGDDDDPQS
ncbi:hypothetical protein RHMOL_Rhmol01G0144100 [Rhododendron molle]|uniref:Uncharacterized protein n=4 Tax=Rhododendron molle TaxID=49168 RepID=A0ACC0Q4R6_RHOML|nr:hypothetical protein RHMOL_Rhmol01G0144100 [Rhododendron molle]KAI8571763.1 hypothetical protein RHMOL_Rhmol01G0144100 [Rhododendron molle]KAI8571764.1 hypothetical protein RHMOL_Rhmol01G0144100 [Rhododendron molle]KAI8571765.1 hypothetical protein RHMOL_Rhmol01G0144100 [Rhododendron molle]